jgi:hypothetical protein
MVLPFEPLSIAFDDISYFVDMPAEMKEQDDAAEALIYGEAEGGESDENLFKAVVSLLRPP